MKYIEVRAYLGDADCKKNETGTRILRWIHVRDQ